MAARLPELDALLISAKGRMAADLVRQITEIPDVYRYQHRLQLASIQELRNSEHASALQILVLFSHGKYKTYMQNSDTLPKLTDKQAFVLRCLSLITLARSSGNQKISFRTIQDEMGLADDWMVFDFLIEALNYGYVTGKIDELAKVLHVEDFATRDLQPDEEKIISAKLSSFLSACDQTMEKLKSENSRLDELKKQSDAQKKEVNAKIDSVKNSADEPSLPVGEMFRTAKLDFGGANKFLKTTRSKGSTKSGAPGRNP